MGKFDKTNKNGALLCHAVGCRKHTKLISRYKGQFCKIHIVEMDKIRNNLAVAKKYKKTSLEITMRKQEIEIRKFADNGHIDYLNYLEMNIGNITTNEPTVCHDCRSKDSYMHKMRNTIYILEKNINKLRRIIAIICIAFLIILALVIYLFITFR